MSKRKRLFVAIGCLLGLAILILVGPIIIASIMREISPKQTSPISSSQPEDLSQPEESKILLMVSGEITVIENEKASYIILTANSGKKYILVGPKAEELRGITGRRATVIGFPSKPIPEEIKGEPIRMTIEVKTVEIK